MKATTLFGPYEPDKPPHMQDGLTDMGNAYPGANGYRPVGQFQQITPALPAAFNGATAFVASDGTGALLGGTTGGIYRYGGSSWTALETGLSPASRWQFTQFGDLAIAVNGSVTKKVDLVANTIADVPGAPTASCVATMRDFVVYGQADGNQAMVQWSAFNDADGNTPGVDQAGFQPMLAGGFVMGIAGGEYAVIVQRSRVMRMSYTGDPDDPMQFDEISANIGAVSKGSIVQSGRLVFFYSDQGFMKCDGNTVTPIGLERVDATFSKLYPRSVLDQMYAAIDPRRNTVAWMMPGNPGLTLVYDYALDKWGNIRMNSLAMFSGFSANYSLDDLDALYPGGLETIPYSLDDPRFSGGDPLLLVVDPTGKIGTLSGANMAAYFTTPFAEYADGRHARVSWVTPIGDAVSGLSVTLSGRNRLGDTSITQVRGTLTDSGKIPARMSKQLISAQMNFDDGAVWSYQIGIKLVNALGGGR